MNKSKRTGLLMVAVLVIAALLLPAASALAASNTPAYAVRLDNLTHTQPFSPPLFVAHTPGYNLFRVGTFASDGIQYIAEMGNNSVAAGEANASPLTLDVVAQSSLILPGGSATAEISAPAGARFSFAAMLGITNDGFTGLDAIKLPQGGSVSFDLVAYDAGTEANNELKPYLAAFGGLLRAPTHAPITNHPGILGVGDLAPAMYGWQNPVGRLTITRIR